MQQDILIIGKPNCGKTLLFNRLTGLEQKVANFPGVTVEIKSGKFGELSLVDFPGIYSLNALSRDEEVAVTKLHDALHRNTILAVICNLDATRLERSLIFGLQAQALAAEHQKPIIFVLNMYDEVLKRGEKTDIAAFSKALGSPVVAVSAKTLFGIDELKSCLAQVAAQPQKFLPIVSSETADYFVHAKALARKYSLAPAIFLKQQNQFDKLLLNNYLGGIIFLAIMAILFQAIFSWAAPLMDLTELAIVSSGEWVTSFLSDGVFKDFINDAIFGGVGSFLVFVPQIFMLTFIIGILEDCGYLGRAAVICHKPLSLFGLSGKSFVPYLSGFACAIPAMMAARTIESPKKRLITILTVPLMACSARLPVYSLFITAFIPATTFAGGLLGYQGLAFFGLYLFGLVIALIISALL
ncbi:MAG: ferrous iron transporter B, partial [Bacteriovoracaceae bacterium]|nr:ferrous iron transporter B [Bacteriovoracaceae bacterium]